MAGEGFWREKFGLGFPKTSRQPAPSGTRRGPSRAPGEAPRVEASRFVNPSPRSLQVQSRAASPADSWPRGQAAPCFTRPAAGRPGRPPEQMECARLLNVMSVDRVGRPMQRPTINLSPMHWVAGSFLSHHGLLGLVFSCQQRLERSAPKHARSSFFLFGFCFEAAIQRGWGTCVTRGCHPKAPSPEQPPPARSKTGRSVLSCPLEVAREASRDPELCVLCEPGPQRSSNPVICPRGEGGARPPPSCVQHYLVPRLPWEDPHVSKSSVQPSTVMVSLVLGHHPPQSILKGQKSSPHLPCLSPPPCRGKGPGCPAPARPGRCPACLRLLASSSCPATSLTVKAKERGARCQACAQ